MKKLLTIACIICCGCETVVDLDVSSGDPVFVLNGVINPDSTIAVEISENRPVLDEGEFKIIEGATVDIYENDEYLGPLEFDNARYYINKDLKPKRGLNYKIEVRKEGYDNISAEAKIPTDFATLSRVKIDSVVNQGWKVYRFELEIDDLAGEDFYEILVYGYWKLYELDEVTQQFYQNDSILVLLRLV